MPTTPQQQQIQQLQSQLQGLLREVGLERGQERRSSLSRLSLSSPGAGAYEDSLPQAPSQEGAVALEARRRSDRQWRGSLVQSNPP